MPLILDQPQRKVSKRELFLQDVDKSLTSIQELMQQHKAEKERKLSEQMHSLQQAQKEREKQEAYSESVFRRTSSYLKNFHPELAAIPSISEKISQQAKNYSNLGFKEQEAQNMAVRDYLARQQKEKIREVPGLPLEEFKKLAKERDEASFKQNNPDEAYLQENYKKITQTPGYFFQNKEQKEFAEEYKKVKNRVNEKKREQLFQSVENIFQGLKSSPGKSGAIGGAKALEFSAALGLGSVLAPVLGVAAPIAALGGGLAYLGLQAKNQKDPHDVEYEQILALLNEEDPDAVSKKNFSTPADLVEEYLLKDLSPKEQEEVRSAATAIELIAPFAVSKGIGKLKNLKNAGKLQELEGKVASVGKQIEELPSTKAAQQVANVAEKQVPNVAEKQVAAAQKSKLPESLTTPKTANTVRNLEKTVFNEIGAAKDIEKQLSVGEKYVKEIEKDQIKLATERPREVSKTFEGELKRAAAAKQLQVVEKRTESARQHLKALEKKAGHQATKNQIATMKTLRKNVQNLEYQERLLKEQIRTGELEKNLFKQAEEKIDKLTKDIQAGKEKPLKSTDYNPETIHRSQMIEKGVPYHGQPEDKFTFAHRVYLEAYENRLKKIQQELLNHTKDTPHTESLYKEAYRLQDMIKHNQAEIKYHNYKRSLRRIKEVQETQNKIKQFKPLRETKTQRAAAKPFGVQISKEPTKVSEKLSQLQAKVADTKKIVSDSSKYSKKLKANVTQSVLKEEEKIVKATGKNSETAKVSREQSGKAVNEAMRYSGVFSQKAANLVSKVTPQAVKDFLQPAIEIVHSFNQKVPRRFRFSSQVLIGSAVISLINESFLSQGVKLPTFVQAPLYLIFSGASPARGVFQYAVNSLVHYLANKKRILNAKKALKEEDYKKFSSYSKTIQKEARNSL